MTVTTTDGHINGVDTATSSRPWTPSRGGTRSPSSASAQAMRISGTHSRSTICGFYGAGQEMEHKTKTDVEADHPAVLVGRTTPDSGGVPAARHRSVPHLRDRQYRRRPGRPADPGGSTVEGNIDLLGILGLSDSVRNGYQQIKVTMHVEGDADLDTLRALVEQSHEPGGWDVLTNGTPADRPSPTDHTTLPLSERGVTYS